VCKTVRERSVVKVPRGTVHEVIFERPIGRAQTYLNVKWGIPSGTKHKRVLLSIIKTADPSSFSPLIDGAPVQDVQTSSDGEEATFGKAGAITYSHPPPDHRNRQTPTIVLMVKNGSKWRLPFLLEVLLYVDGGRAKAQPSQRPQSVLSTMMYPSTLQGDIITESTDFSSITPYN
jgi:hypothetical protein